MKSLRVGDFGVKKKKKIQIFRGSFRGAKFLTRMLSVFLKVLYHEIDFKNVVENGQILALIRAAAGFLIFRRLL